MKSVAENIQEMSNGIIEGLEELLLKHSSIYRWNKPGSFVLATGGDYAWEQLDETGRQIQSKLLEKYRLLNAILRALLYSQAEDTERTFHETSNAILAVIQQTGTTWCERSEDALSLVKENVQRQVGLLGRAYDPDEGAACYVVPDTNALLHNPALDSWRFEESRTFTIVLTPAVLSELDLLKINHRNEDVRRKAERLIRQIKEYRRRGRLAEGVTLVRDVSRIQSIATEPNFAESLSWLDPNNQDDRLLASYIEVMRIRPRSPVLLVTADINLQSKAEFAGLPYQEPPD